MSADPMAGIGRKVRVERVDESVRAVGFREELWSKVGLMPVQTVVRYFWPSGKRGFMLPIHAILGGMSLTSGECRSTKLPKIKSMVIYGIIIRTNRADHNCSRELKIYPSKLIV